MNMRLTDKRLADHRKEQSKIPVREFISLSRRNNKTNDSGNRNKQISNYNNKSTRSFLSCPIENK